MKLSVLAGPLGGAGRAGELFQPPLAGGICLGGRNFLRACRWVFLGGFWLPTLGGIKSRPPP